MNQEIENRSLRSALKGEDQGTKTFDYFGDIDGPVSSVSTMLRNYTETGLPGRMPPKSAQIPQTEVKKERPIRVTVSSASGHLNLSPRRVHGRAEMALGGPQGVTGHLMPHESILSRPVPPYAARPLHSATSMKIYTGHVLNQHASHSYDPHNWGVPSHGRPRSPFAYPTRLKRPGYRPSSPAWSDSNQPARRLNVASRPSSPVSVQSLSRAQSPWAEQTNLSDPALVHYSPLVVQGNSLVRQQSPNSSRTSTPRPTASLRSLGQSSRATASKRSQANLRGENVIKPDPPLFYDYSECFEDTIPHANDPVIETIDQEHHSSRKQAPGTRVIADKRNLAEWALYETHDNGSASRKENRNRISLESEKILGNIKSDVEASPSPRSNLHDVKPTIALPSSPRRASKSTRSQEQVLAIDLAREVSSGNERGTHNDATSTIIKQHSQIDETGEKRRTPPTGNVSSSSSTESMQTAESSAKEDLRLDPDGSHASLLPLNLQHASLAETENSGESLSLSALTNQALLCDDHDYPDSSKIISPIPERSMISEASRQRFSRILGVDDAKVGVGGANSHSTMAEDDTVLHAKSSPNQGHLRTDDKSMHRQTVTDESDPDEVPELSASLMRTFGRYIQVKEEEPSLNAIQSHPDTTKLPDHDTKSLPSIVQPTSTSEADERLGQLDTQALSRSQAPRGNRFAYIIGPSSAKPPEVEETPALASDGPQIVIPTAPSVTKNRKSRLFASSELKANTGEERVSSLGLESTVEAGLDSRPTDYKISDLEVLPTLNEARGSDRESEASSRASRPWNRDSNYPWNVESLKLDVKFPQEMARSPSPTGRFPKFKLRIHRASTSSTGTGHLTKSRSSSDGSTPLKRDSSHTRRPKPKFKAAARQRQAAGPSQENTSHVLSNETVRSRFVESFNSPSWPIALNDAPAINLIPASPGYEIRSFFSEDSAHSEQRGSLRKRLSEFRSRHSQSTSTDDVQGHDRGLRNFVFGRSRINGRTSRRSQTTAGESARSKVRGPRPRILRRILFWWQKREGRPRPRRRQLR